MSRVVGVVWQHDRRLEDQHTLPTFPRLFGIRDLEHYRPRNWSPTCGFCKFWTIDKPDRTILDESLARSLMLQLGAITCLNNVQTQIGDVTIEPMVSELNSFAQIVKAA